MYRLREDVVRRIAMLLPCCEVVTICGQPLECKPTISCKACLWLHQSYLHNGTASVAERKGI